MGILEKLRDQINVQRFTEDQRFVDPSRVLVSERTQKVQELIKSVVDIDLENSLVYQDSSVKTACFLRRLVTSLEKPSASHLLKSSDPEKYLGNIQFSDQFFTELSELNFPATPDGSLYGLPIIHHHSVKGSVLSEFTGQGAKVIGIDMTGSKNFKLDEGSKKNCFFFVANRFVAFAVIQDLNTVMSQYAQESNVYLVSFTTPTMMNDSHSTVAARSIKDLISILTAIGTRREEPTKLQKAVAARSSQDSEILCTRVVRYIDASEPTELQKAGTTVVISLGFKGRIIDSFLHELAKKMREDRYKIAYYFQNDAFEHATPVADLSDLTFKLGSAENYKQFCDKNKTKCNAFNKVQKSGNWTFVLTQPGHDGNKYGKRTGEYQMMIPIPRFSDECYTKHRHHSILINQNRTAPMNIFQFGNDLEKKIGELSGFFDQEENRQDE